MNTIIGKDTVMNGTLDVKGALRIDGCIKGKIICTDTVTVGASGAIEADVDAQVIVVAGKVMGNLIAADRIELQAKADIEGDIKTKSMVVEQGAIFCGSCKMKDSGSRPSLGFLPPDEELEPIGVKDKKKEDF